MQLPDSLAFSEPTLLVRCDHFHAEFYMADGTLLEQLETMSREKEHLSDNETSNANPGSSEMSDVPDLKHFCKQVVEGLTQLKRDGGLEHAYLICDPEMVAHIHEHLPPDVKSVIKKELHQNLMKENIVKVVERMREVPSAM